MMYLVRRTYGEFFTFQTEVNNLLCVNYTLRGVVCTFTRACVCVCVCVCMHACMCACVYVCVCGMYVCVYNNYLHHSGKLIKFINQ